MQKRGQTTTDLMFGITILIAGFFLVILWSLGEAFNNPALSTLGKWGLGLSPIIVEIIRVIVGGWK